MEAAARGSDFDHASALALDGTGNVYLAGTTSGTFEGAIRKGYQDTFVAKLDENGTLLWCHQYGGGSSYSSGSSIAVDPSGDVYLTGTAQYVFEGELAVGYNSGYIAKIGSNGALVWSHLVQQSGNDFSASVAIDANGNCYVVGTTGGSPRNSTGFEDASINKFDSNGKLVWVSKFGGTDYDSALSVTLDGSGNIYVAGTTYGFFVGDQRKGSGDAFIVKLTGSHLGTSF